MECKNWIHEDCGLPSNKTAKDVGMRDGCDGIDRIDRWMIDLVERNEIPHAATLVARRGQVVYFKGVGDQCPDKELSFDTEYRIFSMTKPITSIAILMLVEEGKLRLEDAIHKYLGSSWKKENLKVKVDMHSDIVPCTTDITVKMLLNHTSGLSYGLPGHESLHPVEGQYQKVFEEHGQAGESLQGLLDRIAGLPLLFQPGTKWNYSVGIDLLGGIIEIITKKSLSEFFNERIFKPLDMKNTSYISSTTNKEKLANLFLRSGPGSLRNITKYYHENRGYLNSTYFEPGGAGLISTVRDYARFCQCILNGGTLGDVHLLGRRTLEVAAQNNLPGHQDCASMASLSAKSLMEPGIGFGLGFAVMCDQITATSMMTNGSICWNGAANTHFWIDPKEELVVVFATQLFPFIAGTELRIINSLRNIVYGALM